MFAKIKTCRLSFFGSTIRILGMPKAAVLPLPLIDWKKKLVSRASMVFGIARL